MRKQEVGVLPHLMALKVASLITSMVSLLIKPMVSPFLKGISGKGVSKTQKGGILTLLAAALFLKAISGKLYTNVDHMDKFLYFCSILEAKARLQSISIVNLG